MVFKILGILFVHKQKNASDNVATLQVKPLPVMQAIPRMLVLVVAAPLRQFLLMCPGRQQQVVQGPRPQPFM